MKTSYSEKVIADISKISDFTYDSKNQELIFIDSCFSLKSLRVIENSESQIINLKDVNIQILHNGQSDLSPQFQTSQKDKSSSSLIGNQLDKNEQEEKLSLSSQPMIFENQDKQLNIQDSVNKLNYSSARMIPYISQQAASIPANQQNKLLFSNSGLTVTCMDKSSQIAISTIGFSEGEHFWEFYCPIYCQKIEMGIIAPSIQQFHLIEFHTTTPRQVTFRLNFNTCKLSAYLNGNLNVHKSQILSFLKPSSDTNASSSSKSNSQQVMWYPAIKMSEVGVSVVFNPFAYDPENPISINNFGQKQNQLLQENKLNLDESIKAEVLQRIQQLTITIKDMLDKQHKQVSKKQLNFQTVSENQATDKSKEKQLPYYQINANMKNNNLVIIQNDKIKLIRKDESGQYPVTQSIFYNKPKTPTDYIYLTLNINDTIFLLEKVDWASLIEDNYLDLKEVHSLIELIKISISQASFQNKYIQLHLQFSLAKKCVDALGFFSLQQYKTIHELLHTEKLDQTLFNFPLQSSLFSSSQQSSEIQVNFFFTKSKIENKSCVFKVSQTYDSIIEYIRIMLSLDEQLFAMTLHHEANSQLAQMFANSVILFDNQLPFNFILLKYQKLSRIYSSFCRLGSLMNYTKSQYSPLEMSESGLYNNYDTLSSLRHFEFPFIKIDQLETYKKQIPLWQNISLQIPHSRMMKGQTCLNVPLYITINNIPFQQHIRARKLNTESQDLCDSNQIRILRPNRQYTSNYISTVSSDGCVNVWNTEISLLRVFISDFKRDFVPPKSLKGLLSTNDLKANLKNVESGLFYDLKFPAKPQKKTRGQRQINQKMQFKTEINHINANSTEQKQQVLGINQEIASKLIKDIKNSVLEDTTKETEKVNMLFNQQQQQQEEEEQFLESIHNSQNAPEEEDDDQVSQENELEWICLQCTFRNTVPEFQNECENCKKPRKTQSNLELLQEINIKKQKSKELSAIEAMKKLDQVINQNTKASDEKQKFEEGQMINPIQQMTISITSITQENKQNSSEEKSFIRPEWTCPECDQIVQRSQEICDKCGTHVPEEFKCTYQEYKSLNQGIEKKMKEEMEKKQAKRAEDLKNFFKNENSKVQTGIMINCELSKVCPLIVGVGMNSTKKDSEVQSMLRIRRFGFDPNYLNNFYKLSNITGQPNTTQNGSNIQSSKSVINQLDGSVITEKTMGSIEDSLFRSENNRQVVESIEPLFMSNSRFSNDSSTHQEQLEQQQQITNKKNALFHQDWLELAQHDIVLNEERIIDCVSWCVDSDIQIAHDSIIKHKEMTTSNYNYQMNQTGENHQETPENPDKLSSIFQSYSQTSSPQMMASIEGRQSFDRSQQNLLVDQDSTNVNSLRKEWFRIVLLTETMNQSIKVHIYRIEVDNINPYSSDSIQISILKEFKVSGPGYSSEKSRLFIPECSQVAFLITGNQIVNIPLNQEAIQGASIEAKSLKGSPLCTRFVGKNILATVDSQNNLILMSQQPHRNSILNQNSIRNSSNSIPSIPSTPIQQSLNEKSLFLTLSQQIQEDLGLNQFPQQYQQQNISQNISHHELNIQDPKQISELKSMLNTYHIGSNVERTNEGILKSSIFDSQTKLNVKHSFYQKGFIYFTEPKYLSHLTISFNFQLQTNTTNFNSQNSNMNSITDLNMSQNLFSTTINPSLQFQSNINLLQPNFQFFDNINQPNSSNQKNNNQKLLNLPNIQIISNNNQLNYPSSFNNLLQSDYLNLPHNIEILDDPTHYINNLNNKFPRSSFIVEGANHQDQQFFHLPLTLVYQVGASQSIQQQESLITCPNNESFVTNYAKPSFTFRHLHEKRMIIDFVVVHSIVSSSKGAYPIGSGLVFVADNISFFDMIDSFNGMNMAGYNQWKLQRKLIDTPLQQWEPVGCFEFVNNKEVIKVEMDVKRAAKFVHLLPTNFRSQPEDFTGYFKTGVLDIQYFGVQGQVLEQDTSQDENYVFYQELSCQNYLCEAGRNEKDRFQKGQEFNQEPQFLQFQQQQKAEFIFNQQISTDELIDSGAIKIEVQIEKDSTWHQLNSNNILILKRLKINNPLDNYPISKLPNFLPLLNQILEQKYNIFPSKSLDLRISPKIFFENKIIALRIQLSQNASNQIYSNFFQNKNDSVIQYALKDFSVECFQSKDDCLVTLKKEQIQQYRYTLLDPEKYEFLNQRIIKDVLLQACKRNSAEKGKNKERKLQALKLLTRLMKVENRLVQLFYKDLDLKKFIELMIFEFSDANQENVSQNSFYTENLKEVFEFLYQFRGIFTFSSDLEKVLIDQIQTNIFGCDDEKHHENEQNNKFEDINDHIQVNQRGLKRFFCLLKWCSNILGQQIFDKLLEILQKVTTQFKTQKNANYYLLRYEHNITDFLFEKQLFTNKFISQYSLQIQQTQNKNFNNLNSNQQIQGTSLINNSIQNGLKSEKGNKNFTNILGSDLIIKEHSLETSSIQFPQVSAQNTINLNEISSASTSFKLNKALLKEKEKKLNGQKINWFLADQIFIADKQENQEIFLTQQQKQYLLKSRIHADVDGSTNKIYTIDLMKDHDIKSIFLTFDKVSRSCAVRMKVQIYRVHQNYYYENGFEKVLIYSNDYQTCVTNQLAVLSHQHEYQSLYFNPNSQNLNSLGFSYFEGINTRYLIVQLTFAFVPYASQYTDIEQAARIEVIPEVFGVVSKYQHFNAPLKYFQQLFEGNRIEELKIIKTIQLSPVLNQFQKVQISFANFYLDSLNYYEQQIEQVLPQNSKKMQNLLTSTTQGNVIGTTNLTSSVYFNQSQNVAHSYSPKSNKNNLNMSISKNNLCFSQQAQNTTNSQQNSQNLNTSKASQKSIKKNNVSVDLQEKLKYVSYNSFFPASVSKKKKENKLNNAQSNVEQSKPNLDLNKINQEQSKLNFEQSKVSATEQSKSISNSSTTQQQNVSVSQPPMLLSSTSQMLYPNGGQMSSLDDDLDNDDDLFSMIQQSKKDDLEKLEKDEVKEEIAEDDEDLYGMLSSQMNDDILYNKRQDLLIQVQELQDELSIRLVKYHEKEKHHKQTIEMSNSRLQNGNNQSFPSFKNFSFQHSQFNEERVMKLKQEQLQIQQLCNQIRLIQLQLLNLEEQCEGKSTSTQKNKQNKLKDGSNQSLDFLACLAYELCSFLKYDEKLIFRLIQKDQKLISENKISNTGLNSVKEEDIQYQNGSPKSSGDERKFHDINWEDDQQEQEEEDKNQNEQKELSSDGTSIVKLSLELFDTFIVNESGLLHNEVKAFFQDILLKSINRQDINKMLNQIIQKYLIEPFLQKNQINSQQYQSIEATLNQLKENVLKNNTPFYSASKIINIINIFNIVDVNSFFLKLKEKQEKTEQFLNSQQFNSQVTVHSTQSTQKLQELLLYVWSLTSMLKNEYLKIQLRQILNQQRNQQFIQQQQQQLFEKQFNEDDHNNQENCQGLYICQSLIRFLLQNSSTIGDKDLASLLTHLFDLMLMIINCAPLSHISKVAQLFFSSNSTGLTGAAKKQEEKQQGIPLLYSIFFIAMSLNHQPLLQFLEVFITNLVFPKQLENYSELTICSTQPLTKIQLTEELDKYLETQLQILFHLQQMIGYLLDYPKNCNNSNPYTQAILSSNSKTPLSPNDWIDHLKFLIQILQKSSKSIVLMHKKTQNSTSKKIQEIQRRKTSISSRKSSLASRKNSCGLDQFDHAPTNLTRSKTTPPYNDLQVFNFQSNSNQITLEEYIDHCILDKQMLIQTNIVQKLVELLNPKEEKHEQRKIDEVEEEEFEDDINDASQEAIDDKEIRNVYKFQNNIQIWGLVMSTASLLKGQIIQESNIYGNLINQYLKSSDEVKSVYLKSFLNLTKNILQSGYQIKEFCNELFVILFKIIFKKVYLNSSYSKLIGHKRDSANSSQFSELQEQQRNQVLQSKSFTEDQNLYQLVNGLLEILLTKETPAPEEFYQAQHQQKEWKNSFCKLNARGAARLFIGISKFLIRQLNFGGVEGVHMADEMTIAKLQVADYLLKILLSAESSFQHLSIIEALSNQNLVDILKSSYSRCIIWYFFNKPDEITKGVSPATILIKSIGNQVLKLFTIAGEKQNITEICIELLFKHSMLFSKTLFSNIPKLNEQQHELGTFQNLSSASHINSHFSNLLPFSNENQDISVFNLRYSSITNYNALMLATRQSQIFQELLNLWVINDSIAQFLVFKINGFSHLLDIIGLNSFNQVQGLSDQNSTIQYSSLNEINTTCIPTFGNEDSFFINQNVLNYISSIQSGSDKQLPTQSSINNQTIYNPWNQYTMQNIPSAHKIPPPIQFGSSSFALNKNSLLAPFNNGQNLNSLNSSHIQIPQNAALAPFMAQGFGASSLDPGGGLFGNSDIKDNQKNSFIKYQIQHPSYVNNINPTNNNSLNSHNMSNSNNSNQSFPYIMNHPMASKLPSNINYQSTINAGIKSSQSIASPGVISNTIPQLPPIPPMQYNSQSNNTITPQNVIQNSYNPFINQQIYTSSSSSGNNTTNLNPFAQNFYQQYPTIPLSDLNDSDIISLANNLQQKSKTYELNNPLRTNVANQTQDPLQQLVETECCNQIQLIPLIGQNFQVAQGIQDWSYSKKGCKNKIALHLLSGNQHQELQVLLKLNKTVEIKKFKIGFNCQSAEQSDSQKIIGIPSGVVVEGGLSESKLVPLGFLQQINDDKYLNYGVKVFVKNFARVNDESGNIDKCIKSLSSPKVSYIKLRIIRPIITLIEDSSSFVNKQFGNIAISINFLSIIGYQVDHIAPNLSQFIYKIQTDSAIQILGKLCGKQMIINFSNNIFIKFNIYFIAEGMGFDKTIESISNDKQIIQKIKEGFECIESLISQYEQPISQLLISIALNNDEFADWIFDYLLDSNRNKTPLAKLLTEIIISQKQQYNDKVLSNQALPRVEKLYEYIVKQIKQYLESNPTDRDTEVDADGILSLSSIFPFVDALIAALRISYPHPKMNQNEKEKYQQFNSILMIFFVQINYFNIIKRTKEVMKLRVNIEVIQSLISIYLKCFKQKAEGFSKLSIKLLVSLLYLPLPFYCDNQENLIKESLSLIWDQLIQKKQYQLTELMVVLAYGGEQCNRWFLEDNHNHYKQLISHINQEMSQASLNEKNTQNNLLQSQNLNNQTLASSKKAKNLFSILCAISNSHDIQNLLIQSSISVSSSNSTSLIPEYIKIYSLIKIKKSENNFFSSTSSIGAQNCKLLQNWVDQEFLQLFVEFLKKISHGKQEVIDQIVHGLIEDIKDLEHKKDQLFVNDLLIPVLQSIQTVPMCFHAFDSLQRKWLINPIKVLNHPYYLAKFQQSSKSKVQKNIDKFNTKLFTLEQKQVFMKTLKKFTLDTGLYKKIKKYEWVKEATQEMDSQTSLINKIENKILNNPPYIIVIEGVNSGQKCLCGVFSSQAIQKSSVENTFNISNGDDCFIFYYSENYQIHFRVEGNDFGQLDVSPETSFLTFKYRELDRIYLSFSEGSSSYVDINMFDMKPIENSQNIPHDIPNDFSFQKAEYWVLRPQTIELNEDRKHPFKMENMYDIQNTQHHLFSSEYYKHDNPYNFYRSPAVYHFPENLTLQEIIIQLNVPGLQVSKDVLQQFSFSLRQSSKFFSCKDDIDLKSLYQEIDKNSNGIIDLEYNVDQFFQQAPKNQQSTLPLQVEQQNLGHQKQDKIIDTFIDQKGFKTIISVVKEQLTSWNCKARAKKWLIYVQELNTFSILPNFIHEYMKKKEGVNILFQLLSGSLDSSNELRSEKQEDNKISQMKQPLLDGLSEELPIPKYFKKSYYSQEKNKEDLEKSKQFEEQERNAVQNIYEILAQLFQQDKDNHKIKSIAIENNILQMIFDRISSVSKEQPRKFIDNTLAQEKRLNDDDNKLKLDSPVFIIGVQRTGQGEKDEKSRSNQQADKKKKGTGYASDNTGQNQKWNTNEYVEINKSRNQLLLSLMKILQSFFNFESWSVPPKVIHSICESSLLPLLESSFRSGSLLEICKESQLMIQYLQLVEVMSQNKSLIKCLMKLDQRYQPAQTESISDLLSKLRTTAEIFLNCIKPAQIQVPENTVKAQISIQKDILAQTNANLLKWGADKDKLYEENKQKKNLNDQDDDNIQSQQIATHIIQVHEKLDQAIQEFNEHTQESNSQKLSNLEQDEGQESIQKVQSILELPLNEKYKILLEKLRFGYFSMNNTNLNTYNHHYQQQIMQNQNPSQVKMVRLAQEIADMANSLPIDHTSSIFVRCDSKRVDVMKCIIMGSSGTPYANGAFLYDIFFEDTYPNTPPRVNLQTTGNGKVRFNPNLYNCGKVCLSLLGTWKGQASENWDPKISTLLQVLVSLSAIIMNEDIYFNEPGYEGHSGTEDGEKKNEAYSNIVRYSNIKYAMIQNIRNPPEGFEDVIKRHFYLKKDEILKECEGWIERSTKKQASFVGLVSDHNPQICQEFKQPNKYVEQLKLAVQDLRQELEKLTPPSSIETSEQLAKKKARSQKQHGDKQNKNKVEQNSQKQNLQAAILHNALDDLQIQEIPLNNSKINKQEEIDVESEEVKDRWSRYICAMGIDAVAKQSKCNIFLSGLGPIGVEIAKNIVLSGVKKMTLHDRQIVNYRDLSGQFFLKKEHIGKNRAEACLQDIQLLNHYVRVDSNSSEISADTTTLQENLSLQDYHVVILTECYPLDILTAINSFCRSKSIKFIYTQVQGPFAFLFNDFGDNFEVIDKNGEDPVELVIQNIEQVQTEGKSNRLKVTLLPGFKHPYEDKDKVIIKEVQGMYELNNQNKSINDSIFEIQTINSNSFYLLTNNSYSPYQGSGIVKNIKTPITLSFQSLKQCIQANNMQYFDANMVTHDFEKMETIPYLHIAFQALQVFTQMNSRYPHPWNQKDAQVMIEISKNIFDAFELPQKEDEKTKQKFEEYISTFSFTVSGTFHPLCAFMGGYVSQEVIKAITNKFVPTKQFFFTDCIEVLPNISWSDKVSSQEQIGSLQSLFEKEKEFQEQNDLPLKIVIGNETSEKLSHCKLFMIGSGAIGCELLKNFAMINLCTGEEIPERNLKKGQLTLTDPDHIETSNLNRQFLFRQEHLRKPKSSTAAQAAIKMNSKLKNHIVACLDKVCDGTKHIFTEEFFENQDIVANALDNVEARRYVDKRCVSSKTPLLESGTLGPKGHVQVIIPFKTESYGSQQDPQEEGGDIPHCTLKMFPEETLHCIEWARDKFGKIVTLKPKIVQKTLDEIEQIKEGKIGCEIVNLRKALNALKNRPLSFEDCIEYAVQKFYKLYRNNIRQLLYTYPLNHKNKDGTDFWKLPKRAPFEISQLDEQNTLHRDFIVALSIMRAKSFNIPYPQSFRQQQEKKQIMQIAMNCKVADFQPSDEKSTEIKQEVNEENNKIQGEVDNNQQEVNEIQTEAINNNAKEQKQNQTISNDENPNFLIEQIILQKMNLQQKSLMHSEEFEKDNDSNGHIDAIYAMANLRSINYSLTPMDWINVKLKAGKIVPALATTTAAIAGLQTIELVKTLKKAEICKMKNAFLNLAVPSLQLTEPAGPPTFQITQNIKSSIWDRWDVQLNKQDSLKKIFSYFEEKMQLNIFSILVGTDLIYSSTMSTEDKQFILDNTFSEMSNNNNNNNNNINQLTLSEAKYIDLNILFTELNSNQILLNTPTVRILFGTNQEKNQ
ncbi:hypothetical protein ABPG74_001795 [Tetrahymena malaccensis]